MSSIELALLPVGAAVVKAACKIWLGDHKVAADLTASAIDVIKGRIAGEIDRRKATRLFQEMEEVVVERLAPLLEVEFRGLPEGERIAAMLAVRDTFEEAALDDDDLFAVDVNAAYLDRHLRSAAPDPLTRAGLSASGRALYDRALRECCGYFIEITKTLPRFGPAALTALLERQTEILRQLREVLARLPERRWATDFETDYRRHVRSVLDKVELFAPQLSQVTRHYSLNVAYISLDVTEPGKTLVSPGMPVERALGRTRRLLIRGEAGCGKTTLLEWIAVRLAEARGLPADWGDWENAVPFLIRLRRYATEPLPTAERFLNDLGRHIADEMPESWCRDLLQDGRAAVLIDGVDELPEARRRDVRDWLTDIVKARPQAHYVVTSRMAAVSEDWLAPHGFASAELLPMRPTHQRAFIEHWHAAVAGEFTDEEAKAVVTDYGRRLIAALAERHAVRKLASSPLLCALVCALHHDRGGQLPDNRMELYAFALQMLLERDKLRGLSAPDIPLTEAMLLLQDLAFWLIENGWSDAEQDRVVRQIERRLAAMHRIELRSEEAYRILVERSGVLRRPVEGRVDFVHRSFQEYLAAKAAVDGDRIGELIKNCDVDGWREVVVMAAGHAREGAAGELVEGVLRRGDATTDGRAQFDLVAAACLETAPLLERPLRERIEQRLTRYLPPANAEVGRSLARLGDFILDLLAARHPKTESEVVGTIATCAEFGTDAALHIVARHGADERPAVEAALFAAWPRFDPRQYAAEVLAQRPRHHIRVDDPTVLVALDLLPELHSLQWIADETSQQERLRVLLSTLEALQTLELVSVDAASMLDIDAPPSLRRLVIRGAPRFRDLVPIAHLSHLSELRIEDCRELVDLGGLSRWTALESLHLIRLPVNDLLPLSHLSNLKHLSLEGCHRIPNLRPIGGLSHLQTLDLTDGPRHGIIEGQLTRRGVTVLT